MKRIQDLNITEISKIPVYDNTISEEEYTLEILEHFKDYYKQGEEIEFLNQLNTIMLNPIELVNSIGKYKLIDFDNMTTGEYIDLDFYYSDVKYYANFMSILYRANNEPYNGSQPDLFKDVEFRFYNGAIKAYIEWKIEFIKNFKYLYSESSNETKSNVMGFSDEELFAEEFGWYPMLYSAANEDFLKIDEVTKTKAVSFLTYVNFLKRKNELEANRINRLHQKN